MRSASERDRPSALAASCRFSYQHRWQPGDVLMSDNRCSLHRASERDEATQVRRLHRIIMIDDEAPY